MKNRSLATAGLLTKCLMLYYSGDDAFCMEFMIEDGVVAKISIGWVLD